MSYMDNAKNFENEIRAHGWESGEIHTNGQINRFDTDRRGDKCGWYIAFDNGDFIAGAFGSWKEGSKYKYCSKNGPRTEAEQVFVEKSMLEADEQQRKVEKKAKKRAKHIWDNAKSADPKHPYLIRKGIQAHDAREYKGVLIIPIMNTKGEIVSVQFISGDGTKRFLKGGKVAGGSWTIPGDEQLILCEGFSTAASIIEATGATVRIAFNAGNLLKVAEPGWTIAGDNDQFTNDRHGDPWNPGREKALTAAWQHNCKVLLANFTEIGTKPTDFNDLHTLEGPGQVKKQIEDALYPKDFLLEELKADPGAVYRKEHINGLKQLRERNKATYMTFRAELKKLKVGITELEKDFAKVRNHDDEIEVADHLTLAKTIVAEYGKENLIFSEGSIWKWDNSGKWQTTEPREIKQSINAKVENTPTKTTKSAVDSIYDLLKTEIFIPNHKWNIDQTTINVQNGELSFTNDKWTLQPHCREHYLTTQIPTTYDQEATATDTEQYLEQCFRDDPDKNEKMILVCELLGYSLLTTAKYEKFVILIGPGANGKSVLIELLIGLVGVKNTAAVQPSKFDSAFQRAHLHHKLVNAVSELPVGKVIKDDKMKSITSGELITCEHKFKDPFDMNPYCTIWLATNHMPHTRDFSPALFRRPLIITFNRVFTESEQDKNLKSKLKSELPGILNLALAGIAGVFRRGFFTEPESCKKAKKEWRLQADQAAEFVRDECQMGAGLSIESSKLFEAYLIWAESAGIKRTLHRNTLTTRVCNLGAEKDRASEARGIAGIALKNTKNQG